MDKLTKKKYQNLLYNMNNIKNKMNELNNKYTGMINDQKNSLFIDNHIINEDVQNNVNNDNYKIINEINNIIIPSIKNKIY